MKRIVCFLLALTVLLSLTACGTSASPTNSEAIPTNTPEQSVDTNALGLSDDELTIALDALDAVDAFLDGVMRKSDANSKIKSCSKSFDEIKSENPEHLSVSMKILLVQSTLALFEPGDDSSDLRDKRNDLASSLGVDERAYGKWSEAEPAAIIDSTFTEATESDTVSFIEFQIPSGWRKRHETDSKYTYYYPFEDTTKTFIMIQTGDSDYDFSKLDEVGYNKLWPDYIEGIIRGMQKSDEICDLIVAPYVVNGNRVAIIQGTYSTKSASGAMYNAIFTSHDKMVNVSCLMVDPDKNLSLDDYYAVLCSTQIIDDLSPEETQIIDPIPDNSKYSENGITLSLSQPKYDNSWGGYYYTDLSVKNETASDIYFEVEYVKVNGFQLPVLSYGDVYAGMGSSTQVPFSTDDMKLARIDRILDVEVCVSLSESGNYKSKIDTATLSLRTADAGKYTQTYDFGWQEVYNDRGVRICARLGQSGEKYPAVFFIENNSGRTISLSYNDIAINNSMVGQMMTGAQVVNGARCVTGMQRVMLEMMSDSVPENKDITSMVLKFSFLPIGDDGSFSTANLYYSDKITISR